MVPFSINSVCCQLIPYRSVLKESYEDKEIGLNGKLRLQNYSGHLFFKKCFGL